MVKPETNAELAIWKHNDQKVRLDLIVAIQSKLKQINQVWKKLHLIYQLKDPARKANLLKQLTLKKLKSGDDVHKHMNFFFILQINLMILMLT